MKRAEELAARRLALQLEAEDQRRAVRLQAAALQQGTRPLRRALRWAGTALMAWRLWRQWRARR